MISVFFNAYKKEKENKEMKKRVYLSPMEVEKELQEEREKHEFRGITEEVSTKQMVDSAKRNSHIADKLLLVLSPYHIHIPAWQRKLNLPRAQEIGGNYNSYKWEIPKVLYINGKFICVDGMHRIYGSFLGRIDDIVVEIIIDMSEKEAINLFLEQGTDRKYMSPVDTYGAAIEAGKPEYIKLKEICSKNRVRVKGDNNSIKNPIGVLTSISDGVSMAKSCPETLDKILVLIKKLQWNGANIYDGKAYSAKVLRVLKKLYVCYSGKEKMLEDILLNGCKGEQFFNTELAEKGQDILFDYLSKKIERNAEIVQILPKKRTTKNKALIH